MLIIEGQTVVVDTYVEPDDMDPYSFDITCQLHQVGHQEYTVCRNLSLFGNSF